MRCGWFAGSGLAMMCAAAANIIGIKTYDRTSRIILFLINVTMLGFFAGAWTVLPQPQVIVGGLLFVGLIVSGSVVKTKTHQA